MNVSDFMNLYWWCGIDLPIFNQLGKFRVRNVLVEDSFNANQTSHDATVRPRYTKQERQRDEKIRTNLLYSNQHEYEYIDLKQMLI